MAKAFASIVTNTNSPSQAALTLLDLVMSVPNSPHTSRPSPAMPDPRDPRTTQVIDAPLMALANWSGGDHRKFLYAFFSFLHRRTDFYMVPHPDDIQNGVNKSGRGFVEGDAEKLLLAAFRQFPLHRMPPKEVSNDSKTAGSADTSATDNVEEDDKKPAAKVKAESAPKSIATTTAQEELTDPMHGVRYNDDGKQIPVGNGGSTATFKWTQNLEECTVLLPVPPECSRGKDLDVQFQAKHIRVKSKAPLPGETEPREFLNGDLNEAIKPSESTWSIESGILTLILYKQNRTFWKSVFHGDEEIDTTLVDSRRHIQEYDDSTQAQIRKIIHQQSLMRNAATTIDTSDPSTIPPPEALPPGVEFVDMNKFNLN
ncbi:hypothetical protein MPSEU_000865600 [Mayamaea pseudoterrestris]|nr:hypothetical protein MPSEU_000865600 [Mayamaea pseudoterrestris]